MIKGSQKYDLSQEELHRLYVVEGNSAEQIAKLKGIKCARTVRGYIKKYGLSRTHSEALMVYHNGTKSQPNLTNYEKEILVGELLGDGSLYKDKRNTGECLPYYRHSSKYHEYLIWLASIIPNLQWADNGETVHNTIKKNGGENVKSWSIRSKCHLDLRSLYDDFYGSDGVKRIPRDLKITPTVLRHWFLGDGTAGMFSAGYDRHGNQKKCWQMNISCCNFEREDVEKIVIPQLLAVGIDCKLTHGSKRYRIRIAAKSFDRFYEYIGFCPIEIYQYKWR